MQNDIKILQSVSSATLSFSDTKVMNSDIPKYLNPTFTFEANGVSLFININDMSAVIQSINSNLTYSLRKEDLCITAIKNLIKKVNFLQLINQLNEGGLTERKFQKELKQYPSKYIIETDYLKFIDDVSVISEIVEKVGIEQSIDEVAEMFSIEYNSLCSALQP
jgi:hypothetical protein